MPNLFAIAGPNGSGKSSFSKQLINIDTEVFDGDKHVADLKKEYPETGSDILQKRVNEYYFEEAKANAIQQNKDFAFERTSVQTILRLL
jgi:predicted ABC-type ATPase